MSMRGGPPDLGRFAMWHRLPGEAVRGAYPTTHARAADDRQVSSILILRDLQALKHALKGWHMAHVSMGHILRPYTFSPRG